MQVIEPGQRVEFPTLEQAQAYADAVGGEIGYTLDELSDEAKEKAREWWHDKHCGGALDYEWWDGVYETAKTAGACLGIEVEDIEFSGFWSQGSGACFKGSYAYKKGWRAALKAEFGGDTLTELERIGAALQQIQRPVFYKLTASMRPSNRGNWTEVEVDADIPYSMWRTCDESGVKEEMRSFAHWIYKSLEAEYTWLNADEQVDDTIEANGYLFTEEGRFLG